MDLVTGKQARLGRFALDTLPPLAVVADRADRDLVVALDAGSVSWVLRLSFQAGKLAAQRSLGQVPGKVTGLVAASSGDFVLAAGGAGGGLYGLPRNGGSPRRLAALPRASAIARSGVFAGIVFVVQSGQAGPPVQEPRLFQLELQIGKLSPSRLSLSGYRPLTITGIAPLPTSLGHTIFTGADGSLGMSVTNMKPVKLNLVPALPAGGSTAIVLGNTVQPIVLGGKAHPFLKSFPLLNAGRQNWQLLSGSLPGDPVCVAMLPDLVPSVVPFGVSCNVSGRRLRGGMGGTGFPFLGNAKFSLSVFGALPSSPVLLLLGVSDDAFGPFPLPLKVPGACELFVAPEVGFLATSNAHGLASQTIPIPNVAALKGGILYGQWLQAMPAILATSNGFAVQVF